MKGSVKAFSVVLFFTALLAGCAFSDETESKIETEIESVTEIKNDTEAGSETETESEIEMETGDETKDKSEDENGDGPEDETQIDSETNTEKDTKTDYRVDPKIYLENDDAQSYTLSDTSKEFIGTLEEDVTIYLIGTSDGLDDIINQLAVEYEDFSEHISVTRVKSDTSHTFLKFLKSHNVTTDDLSGYTDVLVVGDKREKFIGYRDIYKYGYNYSTYSRNTTFDGDGEITSAISYVIADYIPKMYVLTGHGEEEFSTTVSTLIERDNIDIESLDIMTEGKIPDDCDIIGIIDPTSDFTEDEVYILEEYITYDGNCVIINNANYQADMPNYRDFLAYYGVEISSDCYIFEVSGYGVENSRWYLYEPLTSNHDITSDFSASDRVMVSFTQPIYQLANVRNTLTIEPFITTSDGSWLRTDLESTLYDEKIDSDVDGPFDIAVTITDQTNEGKGKIVLFSTNDLLSDNFVGTANDFANADLFISALEYLLE